MEQIGSVSVDHERHLFVINLGDHIFEMDPMQAQILQMELHLAQAKLDIPKSFKIKNIR